MQSKNGKLHQDKRSRGLLRVCKFLLTLYQEFQLYSETSQWTQIKERVEMGRWILEGIWKAKRQNHKSAGICSTQKKREIQSRDKHIRTCYWRSLISRTGREMETNCIFTKNNANSWKKL